MTAAFMLLLGILFIWLAHSGKWSQMLSVIRKPAP